MSESEIRHSADIAACMEEAKNALGRNQIDLARKAYEQAARFGSAEAACLAADLIGEEIGSRSRSVCLMPGEYAAQLTYRRFVLYRMSAEAGYTPAMLALARFYERGTDFLAADPRTAKGLIKKAARAGNREACMLLGEDEDDDPEPSVSPVF